MSNTSKQSQSAAHDQRAWSTTATHGSDHQSQPDVQDTSVTDINRSSSSTTTPFSIQRWLAEKPHEGPWNGMVASRRLGEQAGKRD